MAASVATNGKTVGGSMSRSVSGSVSGNTRQTVGSHKRAADGGLPSSTTAIYKLFGWVGTGNGNDVSSIAPAGALVHRLDPVLPQGNGHSGTCARQRLFQHRRRTRDVRRYEAAHRVTFFHEEGEGCRLSR